jgi:hypothetical protein
VGQLRMEVRSNRTEARSREEGSRRAYGFVIIAGLLLLEKCR